MKTRNKMAAVNMAIMLCIGAALISCSDGGDNSSSQEKPQKKPDTTRTLSFGTGCKVTIKSDDLFLTAEWTALCNKVVTAVERGYNSAPSFTHETFTNHFTNNTVSVVLLKTATYDVEVKDGEANIMYLKANGSIIDGISGDDIFSAMNALVSIGGGFVH
jgi:hypothetical protein